MFNTKYLYIIYLLFIIFNTPLYSQDPFSFDVTGTIKNFDGNPVSGAIATLLVKNISDTSDTSGSFSIETSPIIHDITQVKFLNKFELKNNYLHIDLNSKKNVQIELFNIRGKKIKTLFHGILTKGNHRIPLLFNKRSCQVYVIYAKFNNSLIIKKSINMKKNLSTEQIQKSKTIDNSTKRVNAFLNTFNAIDTLLVTHNDYLSKRKWIYSYSDVIYLTLWEKKFRITDEITGWIDQPEYFATFDTIQLYDLIDGGATFYNENGLIDGILQELKNGTDNTCDVFLFNFGTSQKATNMFTEQTSGISSKVLIPGYDESIAVGDEFIGGAIIYAHFDKFEIELSFMGYTDIELLKTDAEIFLQVYESKISNIHLKK